MQQEGYIINSRPGCTVFTGADSPDHLRRFLDETHPQQRIFILTDTNTEKYCLPVLLEMVPSLLKSPLMIIPAGEASKSLAMLEKIWIWLMDGRAGRDSVLVNLGGGVVSDLGGMAAATFKRGISYINVPTTVIGQADAAVGGKTGINVAGIKNQAGVFCNPSAVFVLPGFLDTLPVRDLKSGFAEIIKSAVLAGGEFWQTVKQLEKLTGDSLPALIRSSIEYKCRLVAADPFDRQQRQALNFGHTIGHAFESRFSAYGENGLTHGEAVAAGMICESYLSVELAGLSASECAEITHVIRCNFSLKNYSHDIYNELFEFLEYDKKNTRGGIICSLLETAGKPAIGKIATAENIYRSFLFYNQKAR